MTSDIFHFSPFCLFFYERQKKKFAVFFSSLFSWPPHYQTMDPETCETRLIELIMEARRSRGPPPRYEPAEEPRVKRKSRQRCRRKTFVPVSNNSPPYSKDMKEKLSLFVETEFGKGVENEEKYKDGKWYNYWNRFARKDCNRSPTLEDKCFVCKEEFDLECGEIPKVCGISGCPKVYHRSCWDFFSRCKSNFLVKEKYYDYMETQTNVAIEFVRNHVENWEDDKENGGYIIDECVCPRHYCQQCHLMSCEGMSYCPTCPLSYCSACLGGITCESYCRVCVRIPAVLDAPEMKISKFY